MMDQNDIGTTNWDRAIWFTLNHMDEDAVKAAPPGTILEDVRGRRWLTSHESAPGLIRWSDSNGGCAGDGYVYGSFVVPAGTVPEGL